VVADFEEDGGVCWAGVVEEGGVAPWVGGEEGGDVVDLFVCECGWREIESA